MHENELNVSEELVRSLLVEQCPEWAKLPLQRIQSSGTDNALYRLGKELVVRLPRIDWAVNSIQKEYSWAPKIAKQLSTSISTPIFCGKQNTNFPWPWLVIKWNDGENPEFEQENEYNDLAVDLAQFLNEFHSIKLKNGPLSRRGVHLVNVNERTSTDLPLLKDEINVDYYLGLWKELSSLPEWAGAPVWVHGDFLLGNILVKNNHLSAVIDFSDVGIGDPACDLVIAWSLLNKNSRERFKDYLKNIDENTWQRGRGWALSIAAIMLPYYKDTNPVYAKLARRMLKNVACKD